MEYSHHRWSNPGQEANLELDVLDVDPVDVYFQQVVIS